MHKGGLRLLHRYLSIITSSPGLILKRCELFITLLRRRNVTAVWWFRLWRRFVCRMWTEALNISFLWVLIRAYAGRFCPKGVSFLGFRSIKGVGISLQMTRGARNPNLQVFITRASHVWSQHSFGPPLRMNGMHRTHFDQACLDLLSLVIWSRVFWPSVTLTLRKAQRWRKSVLTLDRCRPHSVTFAYY